MKSKLALFLLFSLPTLCFSQEIGDKKIIITIADTGDIYNRVRIALGKNDFIIREDGNKDTIATHPTEVKNIAGYSRLTAVITGNTVTLYGIYSLIKMDDFGYTRNSKRHKPIVYYKNSKTWKKMHSVASELGGEMTFSK
jgi:hypothetical protein